MGLKLTLQIERMWWESERNRRAYFTILKLLMSKKGVADKDNLKGKGSSGIAAKC